MLKRSSDYHFVSTAAISYNTVKTSARTHQVSMLNIESYSKGGHGGMQTATDSTTSVSREGWVLLKGERHKKSIITCISSFHVKFHLVIQWLGLCREERLELTINGGFTGTLLDVSLCKTLVRWRLLRTHGSISNECFMNSLLHHCYKRGTDYVRLKPDLQSGKFFFQYLVRPSLLMGFNTESYQANF